MTPQTPLEWELKFSKLRTSLHIAALCVGTALQLGCTGTDHSPTSSPEPTSISLSPRVQVQRSEIVEDGFVVALDFLDSRISFETTRLKSAVRVQTDDNPTDPRGNFAWTETTIEVGFAPDPGGRICRKLLNHIREIWASKSPTDFEIYKSLPQPASVYLEEGGNFVAYLTPSPHPKRGDPWFFYVEDQLISVRNSGSETEPPGSPMSFVSDNLVIGLGETSLRPGYKSNTEPKALLRAMPQLLNRCASK